MPELTLVQIALPVAAALAGIVLGWIYRSNRSRREKKAISAGWQAQIDSQQTENDRLADQNKSLMEQINQYQASTKDAKMRAKELSDSLKEAFARRDELQRQMKEIRSNLEIAVVKRENLMSDVDSISTRDEATISSLKEKDETIIDLQKKLANWHGRVPPLIERLRQRDLDTQQLEVELQSANDRLAQLESIDRGEHTLIEPLDSSSLPDGLDASNEPHSGTSIHYVATGPADLVDDEFAVSVESGYGTERSAFPNAPVGDYPGGMHDEDDLKKIKGIGPAIEKTLNELGICRFNQIAEISEYDIDRVAQQLKGFRSRIYREDWIGQARLLLQQRNHDERPV